MKQGNGDQVKAERPKAAEDVRKPAHWLYVPLCLLARFLFAFVYRLKIRRGPALKAYKGPLIVLGNHCSYADPLIMACALGLKWRINFLAASFIFSGSFAKFFFRTLGVIPTTQFATNPSSTRQMIKRLRAGGCVAFYPEAERSAFGELTLFDMTSAKFIKMMKVPVALCLLHGAYLTWPRWAPAGLYSGKIEAEAELLFGAEELAAMTVEEIHALLCKAIDSSDYDWQKKQKHPQRYRRGRTALGLHKQLFRCVRCGSEFTLRSAACELFCESCGGRWTIGEDGFFTADVGQKESWLKTPLDWQLRQYELQRVDFLQANFMKSFRGSLSAVELKASLKGVPLALLGKGDLQVDRNGLRFLISEPPAEAAASPAVSALPTALVGQKAEYAFSFLELQGMMMEYGDYFQIYHSGHLFQCHLDEGQACALVRACWSLARPSGMPGVKNYAE